MDNWKKISFLVGVFAFIREFRPIEPFYAAYMTSPYINCTVEQVMHKLKLFKYILFNRLLEKSSLSLISTCLCENKTKIYNCFDVH